MFASSTGIAAFIPIAVLLSNCMIAVADEVPDVSPLSPLTPVADRFPGGSGMVEILFKGANLPQTVDSTNFRVYQQIVTDDNRLNFTLVPDDGNPTVSLTGNRVVLNFLHLNPGSYRIVIHDLADADGKKFSTRGVTGRTDKAAVIEQGVAFSVAGSARRGEHVPYPRFLQPQGAKSEFDPGDRVDTRTVRLYYFRDARRVVELINRNVENLNQHGYDEAQRFAAQARRKAEDRIAERRMKELKAIEDARKTRAITRRLEENRQELDADLRQRNELNAEKNQLLSAVKTLGLTDEGGNGEADLKSTRTQLNDLYKSISAAEDNVDEKEDAVSAARRAHGIGSEQVDEAENALKKSREDLTKLRDKRTNLQRKLTSQQTLQTRLETNKQEQDRVQGRIDKLTALVDEAGVPKELTKALDDEIKSRSDVADADARELRAVEERFRRELAAGLADPDTYAKGEPSSIDPVTQVTISVVGTSRIHLRGPIKGINKICRMIHQIDSPVGQVKIGIHTVQVNGEHGDRMDFVYEKINKEVAHSRFLVNASGQMLRRAVAEVASEVAVAADGGYLPHNCPDDLYAGVASIDGPTQTTQDIRDRRYLYAFFGSDFIGELEEMDSELLNTENKMLSLNSMDTISLAGALSVTALADAPIRERIMMRLQELLASELPDREFDYVRALTHVTRKGKSLQNRFRKAMRIDGRNAEEIYFNANRTYTFPNTVTFFKQQIPGQGVMNPVQYATVKLAQTLKAQLVAEMELNNLVLERSLLEKKENEIEDNYREKLTDAAAEKREAKKTLGEAVDSVGLVVIAMIKEPLLLIRDPRKPFGALTKAADRQKASQYLKSVESGALRTVMTKAMLDAGIDNANKTRKEFGINVINSSVEATGFKRNATDVISDAIYGQFILTLETGGALDAALAAFQIRIQAYQVARQREAMVIRESEEAEGKLFSKRLLEQFIDEQEEKSVELMEALRAHSSNVDNYLKRLAIAMEDDVEAQFYQPAFQRIRRVSRTWDVTLSQIETTTVLTNNRTLAKVDPSATFEFDLPKRDILLTEALNGSKALATEYGNLLKDGTFLAGAEMLSGQPATGVVGDSSPIQAVPGLPSNHQFGSDLQQLIPDPDIYKFETGTGFEIRPIIQPDGHSIVYTFDYLYSTNVREPVRADEKHLGRIKRHFVHTDVQTSSYELREVTRYTVALKASRTARGVPLLEDVPIVGAAFRPLPSEESSLQTNIILGSSTIYPTVFDLMGLRWSRYVDEVSSHTLATQKETQESRRRELRSHLLKRTASSVNQRLRLPMQSGPASHSTPNSVIMLP